MLRERRVRQFARIGVVGVGGGGLTALNHVMSKDILGVECIAVDTDPETLHRRAGGAITIHVPNGQGGSVASWLPPSAREDLAGALSGADIVFLLAGFGGRTGTKLAPVVADVAREQGALTVAAVTLPFSFEGPRCAHVAKRGLFQLHERVNTLIVIPNDRLLEMAGGEVAFHETFQLADEIWFQSIRGIYDLVNVPGLVNVDFADVRAIMSMGGPSIITRGSGRGEQRAEIAAEQATRSPLLGATIDGARGVLFNISGGVDMTLQEVKLAAAVIRNRIQPDASFIFGAAVDVNYSDEVVVTLVATGCGYALSDFIPSDRLASGEAVR